MIVDPERIISAKFSPFDYCECDSKEPYNVIMNGLKEGHRYAYINSDFIQGITNMNDGMFGAFMFRRYTNDEEWKESVEYIDNGCDGCHTSLHKCNDDVIMLNKIYHEEGNGFYYIWLWYDHDVSDCDVGIFDSGNVNSPDDAFYSLMKEVLTHSIGEFTRCPRNDSELRALINTYGIENLIKFIPRETLHGWIRLTR